MSALRQRKNVVKIIQELDAFPKVEEDHKKTSATGGGLSLAVFSLIIVLVIGEISYYVDGGVKYQYDIDPNFDRKLKLNIDIMVAMKCSHVGADILDLTGENAESFGVLEEESVNFDLNPVQADQFRNLRSFNSYLRHEYHSIHETLWKKSGSSGSFDFPSEGGGGGAKPSRGVANFGFGDLFPIIIEQNSDPNEKGGCRFRGSLEVNKVAGNFHITAGKPVLIGGAHVHFGMADESEYNFSHRILHFGFGEKNTAIVNPLDGEEKIVDENNHIFQYYIQVVPTLVQNSFSSQETYQYAATEQNRTISHAKGSHGLPGIFIKYDLSPLRITVAERSSSLTQLLVKLCAIVGGIFATSGFLHQIITGLINLVCCRFFLSDKKDRNSYHHDNSPAAAQLVSLLEVEKLHPKEPTIAVSLTENGGGAADVTTFRDL